MLLFKYSKYSSQRSDEKQEHEMIQLVLVWGRGRIPLPSPALLAAPAIKMHTAAPEALLLNGICNRVRALDDIRLLLWRDSWWSTGQFDGDAQAGF